MGDLASAIELTRYRVYNYIIEARLHRGGPGLRHRAPKVQGS